MENSGALQETCRIRSKAILRISTASRACANGYGSGNDNRSSRADYNRSAPTDFASAAGTVPVMRRTVGPCALEPICRRECRTPADTTAKRPERRSGRKPCAAGCGQTDARALVSHGQRSRLRPGERSRRAQASPREGSDGGATDPKVSHLCYLASPPTRIRAADVFF